MSGAHLPNLLEFRCDDHAGFELHVLRAYDGDIHLSVVPHTQDFKRERPSDSLDHYAPCYTASVRLRMPMIGGGEHERLFSALASLFYDTPPVILQGDEAEWLRKRRLDWEAGPPLLKWKLDQGKL